MIKEQENLTSGTANLLGSADRNNNLSEMGRNKLRLKLQRHQKMYQV